MDKIYNLGTKDYRSWMENKISSTNKEVFNCEQRLDKHDKEIKELQESGGGSEPTELIPAGQAIFAYKSTSGLIVYFLSDLFKKSIFTIIKSSKSEPMNPNIPSIPYMVLEGYLDSSGNDTTFFMPLIAYRITGSSGSNTLYDLEFGIVNMENTSNRISKNISVHLTISVGATYDTIIDKDIFEREYKGGPVINDLNSFSTASALSASQGRVLNNLISQLTKRVEALETK